MAIEARFHLTVTRQLGAFAKGHVITDPYEVASILAGPKHVLDRVVASPRPSAVQPVRTPAAIKRR